MAAAIFHSNFLSNSAQFWADAKVLAKLIGFPSLLVSFHFLPINQTKKPHIYSIVLSLPSSFPPFQTQWYWVPPTINKSHLMSLNLSFMGLDWVQYSRVPIANRHMSKIGHVSQSQRIQYTRALDSIQVHPLCMLFWRWYQDTHPLTRSKRTIT